MLEYLHTNMPSYSSTQSYNIKLLFGAHKLHILSLCGLLDHCPLTRNISIKVDLKTTSPENLKLKTEKERTFQNSVHYLSHLGQ